MARLVNGHGAALLRYVLDADCGAGFESGHRFDEVVPGQRLAVRVVRDRERHRRDLLEHCGRVPVRHARDLLALVRLIELLLVSDFPDVQVEDVEAILLGRRAEPDVPPHAARAGQGRIEPVDRDVRRADEVDLLLARACAWDAERALADAAGDDVDPVEQGVHLVGEELLEERRVVDSVHDDEQLVQGERASTHAAREHEVEDAVHTSCDTGRAGRLRRTLREEALAPLAGLEDEVA